MTIAENLKEIHNNVQRVYDAGRQAQEQEFWDAYMIEEYDMTYMFAGMTWNINNFKPCKKMKPTVASGLFALFDFRKRADAMDLVERLEELGVTLDFSICTNMQQCFSQANISRVGVIDCRKLTSFYGMFSNNDVIHTIDNLIVCENLKYSSMFLRCIALENLTITGTIGQEGLSVAQSTLLTKESILGKEATEEQIQAGTNLVLLKDKYYYGGIFGALSDTTSGLTVTLSKTAVNNAFETAKGNADGSTSEEWAALIATKQNWTISLV